MFQTVFWGKMKNTWQVLRSLDESAWKKFINTNPKSNVFHTPEMQRVFARTHNHRPQLWAVAGRENVPLALFLPVEIILFPSLKGLTTRTVSFGSILYEPTAEGKEALFHLLDSYLNHASHASLFTELRNLSDMGDVQDVLQKKGFKARDELNFLIHLDKAPEQLLQSMGARTRKKIRRGLRENKIRVSELRSKNEISSWYELLRQTYRRAKIPLAPRSLFESAFEELVPAGMAIFLQAKIDGKLVACSLELIHKDIIYGWYCGVDRAYSRFSPSEMLIWKILRWGAENGFQLYDFGLAGQPGIDYGVRNFKAKFGGELVNFGRNICVHKPVLLKVSRWGYRQYRRHFRLFSTARSQNPKTKSGG